MANIIRIGKGKLPKRIQKNFTTLPPIAKNELVTLRIDHKTVIYIRKGEDAQKAKDLFLLRVEEQRNGKNRC